MGQYKVPQNVESEDKIIGPLTLKQFIYTVIGVLIAVFSYLVMHKTPIVMLIVGLPPTALFLLLGLYQRQDQPFEAIFISIISFFAKPRKRLWTKEPIEQVFKIEAPKVVKQVTQRDPQEVLGQLEKLSQIVDTRGWGSKRAELQEPTDQPQLESEGRIITPEPPEAAETIATDVSLADDILDVRNNRSAHDVDSLIKDQAKHVRDEAVQKLHEAATHLKPTAQPNASYVIPDQPQPAAIQTSPAPEAPPPAPIQPPAMAESGSTTVMTTNPLDGILKLAMENDDLTVSQVAHVANRQGAINEGQSISLRTDGQ